MASYPSIEFPNNIVPKALQSDNVFTSSLNVLRVSTLNTLQSNTINNTADLSSNTITSTGFTGKVSDPESLSFYVGFVTPGFMYVVLCH